MPHLEAVAKNGTVIPRRVVFFFFSKEVSKGALQNCEVLGQMGVLPGRQLWRDLSNT